MPDKITLQKSNRRAILQTIPDYDVLLNGVVCAKAFFNTRGYVVDKGLPMPSGSRLDPGEISLTKLKREIMILNREAATKSKAA